MSYEKINWENYPSTNTPINAENLSKMDEGIFSLSKDKVDKEDGKGLSTNDFTDAKLESLSSLELAVPFKFGIDEDGNYGYYKAGADTVTPFKTGGIVANTELFGCFITGSGGFTTIQGLPMFYWKKKQTLGFNSDVIDIAQLDFENIFAVVKNAGKYSLFIFINNYSDKTVKVIHNASYILNVSQRSSNATSVSVKTTSDGEEIGISLEIPAFSNSDDRLDLVLCLMKEKDEEL